MIFLSHTHADKPIVEQFALRLASALGKDQVFYDSWAIQPGDGIIDKMSDALAKCTHFFFFVSANSLKSRMVSLEWQNALLKATKGTCRMVAVRCDQSELPPIMAQSLYIDLFSVGLEAAIAQVANVVAGTSTYASPARPFSNLAATFAGGPKSATYTVQARYFLEPIAHFLVLVKNVQSEVNGIIVGEGVMNGGFANDLVLENGTKCNAIVLNALRGITPTMPMQLKIDATGEAVLQIVGLLYQKGTDQYEPVPLG
jgi:hypothetical protein